MTFVVQARAKAGGDRFSSQEASATVAIKKATELLAHGMVEVTILDEGDGQTYSAPGS